jgi:DnaJ family protein C protein 9
MGLLEDCVTHFETKDLYKVLNVDKKAKESDIKKAFRRLSLKCHPDRHQDLEEGPKQAMTAKFQTLSKVHFILSDVEKRAYYDSTGAILNEDGLDAEADWDDYFRLLFPKVTTSDIDQFMDNYKGSEDELKDLKAAYIRYEGDMDKISQAVIGFEEERHRALIQDMINDEDVPEFEKFTNESDQKKKKRSARAVKEAKLAEKELKKRAQKKEKAPDNDLIQAIQSRSKGNFNSMISRLEAKYSGDRGEDEEDEEEEEEEESEEEEVKPTKRRGRKPKATAKGKGKRLRTK